MAKVDKSNAAQRMDKTWINCICCYCPHCENILSLCFSNTKLFGNVHWFSSKTSSSNSLFAILHAIIKRENLDKISTIPENGSSLFCFKDFAKLIKYCYIKCCKTLSFYVAKKFEGFLYPPQQKTMKNFCFSAYIQMPVKNSRAGRQEILQRPTTSVIRQYPPFVDLSTFISRPFYDLFSSLLLCTNMKKVLSTEP